MRRALCLLGCLALALVLTPALAAEEAAAALPVVTSGQMDVPGTAATAEPAPALPDFLLGLQEAQPLSDCPGPWECIQICYSQGCLTTNGCDGMGGCLCSNCS